MIQRVSLTFARLSSALFDRRTQRAGDSFGEPVQIIWLAHDFNRWSRTDHVRECLFVRGREHDRNLAEIVDVVEFLTSVPIVIVRKADVEHDDIRAMIPDEGSNRLDAQWLACRPGFAHGTVSTLFKEHRQHIDGVLTGVEYRYGRAGLRRGAHHRIVALPGVRVK